MDLDKQDVLWMKEASEVGIHTGKFSHLYEASEITMRVLE